VLGCPAGAKTEPRPPQLGVGLSLEPAVETIAQQQRAISGLSAPVSIRPRQRRRIHALSPVPGAVARGRRSPWSIAPSSSREQAPPAAKRRRRRRRTVSADRSGRTRPPPSPARRDPTTVERAHQYHKGGRAAEAFARPLRCRTTRERSAPTTVEVTKVQRNAHAPQSIHCGSARARIPVSRKAASDDGGTRRGPGAPSSP